jgi:hypothetical protein
MHTEDHGLGLAGQMRDADGPLPAFGARLRDIDDITHGFLLPEIGSTKLRIATDLNSRRLFAVKGTRHSNRNGDAAA